MPDVTVGLLDAAFEESYREWLYERGADDRNRRLFAFRLPNVYHSAGTRHNVARRAGCGAVAPDEEEQERWQE